MLVVLSPSKTLDFDSKPQTDTYTQPDFLNDSRELIEILRGYDVDELRDLMDISEKLAVLNVERYDAFSAPFSPQNAKPAITAFTGDVYRDFRLADYTAQDFDFLQRHVRIVSGLYGLLRPLDLIQAYRLEMGTKLENARGKNLYEFWGHKITDALRAQLDAESGDVLVNLASNEYFDSIDTQRLARRVLNVTFKDLRHGEYKIITFYLKQMRGTMTDWIVRHRVSDPQALKAFDEHGYYFSEQHSTDDEYVFVRDAKP